MFMSGELHLPLTELKGWTVKSDIRIKSSNGILFLPVYNSQMIAIWEIMYNRVT